MVKKLLELFMKKKKKKKQKKKKKKKANQIEFRIEIVIKEKCDEHNFQWRRYGYSFRNWVDE